MAGKQASPLGKASPLMKAGSFNLGKSKPVLVAQPVNIEKFKPEVENQEWKLQL